MELQTNTQTQKLHGDWTPSKLQTLSRPEFPDLGALSHPGPSCYAMDYIHNRLNDTQLIKVRSRKCFHVWRVQFFLQFQNRSRPEDAYFLHISDVPGRKCFWWNVNTWKSGIISKPSLWKQGFKGSVHPNHKNNSSIYHYSDVYPCCPHTSRLKRFID